MTTGDAEPVSESVSPQTGDGARSGAGTTARRGALDLPVRIFLTQRGVQFFVQNRKKLNRFSGEDPSSREPEYGLFLRGFSAASIQRMVLLGYVARIEVASGHLSGQEGDIFDLTKLLLYSMLYHQFDSRVYDEIFESDLIVRWNRRHLRNPIDRDRPLPEAQLTDALRRNESAVATLRTEVVRPVVDEIEINRELSADERRIRALTAEKFVNNLRPFTWFILAQFRGSGEYFSLVTSMREIMGSHLDRTAIAEYAALVTREVVANAENINLQDFARLNYGDTWDSGRILFDKELRARLVREMSGRGKTVSVVWTMTSRSGNAAGLNNLRIVVQNHQPEALSIPSPDEDRSLYDRRKSLREYYAEVPETVTNTELALYYYGYLTEACRTRGVRFESSVHDSRRNG
ncbi:hypothetical protein, partial [Salinispira pacifica]